jgi:hypothetical protein
VLFFLLLVVTPAGPAAAEWKRLDSPNFVVVGDVSAGDLRQVARRFEGFRETLGRVLPGDVTASAVPTIVLVFPSDRAFTPFKPRYNGRPVQLGGLFMRRPDANYIALVRGLDEAGMRVIFHEYAHLVISNATHSLPLWLNEGIAEFYSTFELRDGGAEALIGRPIADHVHLLREASLLPMEQLVAVRHDSPLYNEGHRRSVFYAQSWALAHMLLVEDPQRRAQLGTYMAALQDGLPPSEAWALGFGTDRVDRLLQSYVSRRSFRYYQFRFESRVTQVHVEATPLAATDAEAFLADFLAKQERYDEALARLDKASAGREESAWASAVRASIEVARKEFERADERLLALSAPADWLAAYVAGTTLVNSFAGRAGGPDAAQARAGEAFFRAAGEGREEIPNAAAKAAMLSLMRDEDPGPEGRAGVARAREAAPGRHDYALIHARILMRQSELAAARTVLESLDADGQPQGVRESARQMLGTIDRLEVRRAGAPPAGAPTAAAPAAVDAPASTGGPSAIAATPAAAAPAAHAPALHATDSPAPPRGSEGPPPGVDRPGTPVFREIGAGEERVEGVLTAIECRQGAIVFHLDGQSPATRLSAPSFDDVDFITYRSDLTGSVSCGPMKEPMRVYVTVGPAAGGERVVVAVEVLPRADRE